MVHTKKLNFSGDILMVDTNTIDELLSRFDRSDIDILEVDLQCASETVVMAVDAGNNYNENENIRFSFTSEDCSISCVDMAALRKKIGADDKEFYRLLTAAFYDADPDDEEMMNDLFEEGSTIEEGSEYCILRNFEGTFECVDIPTDDDYITQVLKIQGIDTDANTKVDLEVFA